MTNIKEIALQSRAISIFGTFIRRYSRDDQRSAHTTSRLATWQLRLGRLIVPQSVSLSLNTRRLGLPSVRVFCVAHSERAPNNVLADKDAGCLDVGVASLARGSGSGELDFSNCPKKPDGVHGATVCDEGVHEGNDRVEVEEQRNSVIILDATSAICWRWTQGENGQISLQWIPSARNATPEDGKPNFGAEEASRVEKWRVRRGEESGAGGKRHLDQTSQLERKCDSDDGFDGRRIALEGRRVHREHGDAAGGSPGDKRRRRAEETDAGADLLDEVGKKIERDAAKRHKRGIDARKDADD
ncbi:hypothetical protein BDV93DRAFT_514228 [Ceratobasidium sp. AG-I]|nr:hypothetical protein BDV93DRAFT_514228 [Ceratobasidium sp. AG-I]